MKKSAEEVATTIIANPHLACIDSGKWMSQDLESSQMVLHHFVENIPMSQDLLASLRELSKTVVLPTNPAQLERMMKAYCGAWYRRMHDSRFENSHAVFVLAFSIIMMDTSKHIMGDDTCSFMSFSNSVTGANDGNDFSKAMLLLIFESIQRQPLFPKPKPKKTSWLWFCSVQ